LSGKMRLRVGRRSPGTLVSTQSCLGGRKVNKTEDAEKKYKRSFVSEIMQSTPGENHKEPESPEIEGGLKDGKLNINVQNGASK